jgi:hypothetical protein
MVLAASPGFAQVSSSSQPVTWNCTSDPCPWGSSVSGNAIVWPATAAAGSSRHGYTTSQAIYLPTSLANGLVVSIASGTAYAYAGTPSASSHRFLTSISAGGTFTVSGLEAGEVLSVQNDDASFAYVITLPSTTPPAPPTPPTPPAEGTLSVAVVWNCTGTPCPWGNSDSGKAIEWPAAATPSSARFGYTTTKAIYLGASHGNGTTIHLFSGTAGVYAGAPNDGSHRQLTTISAGGTYTISGLASSEVVSVQSDNDFAYQVTLPTVTPPAPGVGTPSEYVAWSCTGTPCPWGDSEDGQALVWPVSANATSSRLGYTVTKPIYLPRIIANGTTITVHSGTVTAYAGQPAAPSHHAIVTISAGGTYTFSELTIGEVLSVQSDSGFRYDVTLPAVVPEPEDDPVPGMIKSVPAIWRCNVPGCTSADWYSAVINWPASSAYSSNARAGESSRTVYGESGQQLYPYMGTWANGCEVTAHSGVVLIIEWQRGTDTWRETWLNPGESHTIHLTPPENNAMIESFDFSPGFGVTLSNCTPHALP